MNKIFSTIEEAVDELKLDRRRKWFEFMGNIVYDYKHTLPCSGCSCDCGCLGSHGNSGCRECGYKGKRRSSVPVPAMWLNGDLIEIKL